jgi:hypothetical protein
MSNSINSGGGAGKDAGESKLRGDGVEGSDSKNAADHADYLQRRNPDTTVRVDNEPDSLYSDGLELDDDTPPMGTDGRSRDNAR